MLMSMNAISVKKAKHHHRRNFFTVIFSLALFLSQFNAFFHVPGMGEMGGDPFSVIMIFFSPLIIYDIARQQYPLSNRVFLLFFIFLVTPLFVSALINIIEISSADLKGRQGIGKLITASLVYISGLYFAYVTYICAMIDVRRFFINPIIACAILVISVSVFEYLSWHNEIIHQMYLFFSKIIHSQIGRGQYVVGRIHSITVEPSYFGMFTIFVLPIIFIKMMLVRRTRINWWSILMIVTLVMSYLSGRTAFIGGGLSVILCFGLFSVYRCSAFIRRYVINFILFLFGLLFFFPLVYIALYADQIGEQLSTYGSVSNVSRFGTIAILLKLFVQNPFFGVGMGQYGFHVPSTIPSWAYNWEFKRWIFDANASFFPSFSVFARLAGELGGLGLGCWSVCTILLLNGVMRRGNFIVKITGDVPLVGIAIAAEIFGMLIYGWTAGSLRMINIWCAFGLGVAYISNSFALESAFRGPAWLEPRKLY